MERLMPAAFASEARLGDSSAVSIRRHAAVDQCRLSLSHAPSVRMTSLTRTKSRLLRIRSRFKKSDMLSARSTSGAGGPAVRLQSSLRQKQNPRQPDDLSAELRASVRRRRLQVTMIE